MQVQIELHMCFYLVMLVAIFENIAHANIYINASTDLIIHVFLSCYAGHHI
jgi:hypothetical protein